jgi:cell volume regulation protein A
VFLTVGLISLVTGTASGPLELFGSFILQMGIGVVAGAAAARGAVWLINRLRLEYDGLYPVLTIALVLLTYEGTAWLGGSGFVAVYVAGLSLASAEFLHKRSLLRFHDAIGWLMQIAMFVLMGLLVFPSQLLPAAGHALVVAATLMFVARPVAVLLALLPFRIPLREIGFVSWVGLRGATPIILATFPVVARVPEAETMFHVVFFVVLMSVLVQGTTIPMVARWLGVVTPDEPVPAYALDAVISGDEGFGLREVEIPAHAAADGRTLVDAGLPAGVLVVLIRRAGRHLVPQGRTVLAAGDRLLILADDAALKAVRETLTAEPRD